MRVNEAEQRNFGDADVFRYFQVVQVVADHYQGHFDVEAVCHDHRQPEGILEFGEKTTEILYMLSPTLIMNALNGYSEMTYALWGLLFLGIYLTAVILSGIHVFLRQDELNYGE